MYRHFDWVSLLCFQYMMSTVCEHVGKNVILGGKTGFTLDEVSMFLDLVFNHIT